MTKERKLPVCVKCGQAIRKSEYMQDEGGAYHIVCPLTPDQRVLAASLGISAGRSGR